MLQATPRVCAHEEGLTNNGIFSAEEREKKWKQGHSLPGWEGGGGVGEWLVMGLLFCTTNGWSNLKQAASEERRLNPQKKKMFDQFRKHAGLFVQLLICTCDWRASKCSYSGLRNAEVINRITVNIWLILDHQGHIKLQIKFIQTVWLTWYKFTLCVSHRGKLNSMLFPVSTRSEESKHLTTGWSLLCGLL